MNLVWLDRVGDRNPQFFRELKGRLKFRNIAIPTAVSLLTQFLIVMPFYLQITDREYSYYCIKNKQYNCLRDAAGYVTLEWQRWWHDLLMPLTWILPFVLLLGGVYMLIADIGKEQQRGTLNFIRLSPESSENILLGKMLGVPILLYWGILLAIPLHLAAAIGSGISLTLLFGSYLLMLGCCFFFYNITLIYSFQVVFNAWLATFLTFIFASPFFQVLVLGLVSFSYRNADYDKNLQWFYLPIGSNLLVLLGFLLGNCWIWNNWAWQALNRRFRQPNATLISKTQSYWVTTFFQVSILGFLVGNYNSSYVSYDSFWDWFGVIALIEGLNLLGFMFLIGALSPHRQEVQDWARYRRWDNGSSRKGFWNRSLVKDLVWGEKSPALVAIAINLAIKTAIWATGIIILSQSPYKLKSLAVLLLSANSILILAAIVQRMLMMKTPKRSVLSFGALTAFLFLPLAALALFGIAPHQIPLFWLFTALPWLGMEHATATGIFITLLGQWTVLGLLSVQLTRKLRLAGETTTKAIFSGRPSLPAD